MLPRQKYPNTTELTNHWTELAVPKARYRNKMHYIRLLRGPKLDASNLKRPLISILLTITTDLGDSFLYPDEPVDLAISVENPTGQSVILEADRPPRWTAGMRCLDVKVSIKPHLKKDDVTCTIRIHPTTQTPPLGVLKGSDMLPWRVARGSPASEGLIMPVSVEMAKGICSPVAVRTLRLDSRSRSQPRDQMDIDLEEDIGESIARHIWDAGVVTASFFGDACSTKEGIYDTLPMREDGFNILELGSGVGILGITLAQVIERAVVHGHTSTKATVLLTDLPEAEERARSNISRAKAAFSHINPSGSTVALQYEDLDWDEGKHGQFGTFASARPWDLVVLSDCTYNVDSLPALVGTLSALHTANLKHDGVERGAKTFAILATKPRHSSEQALFGLLTSDDWQYNVLKSITLPKLGEEDEAVYIYLLKKG
ncbi:putative methyltransferase-domain-containing protein [Daldinia decipiens]|uniref:putative methyltransferase-domain-containing protein n=1 Tax=Daldinia decipiens TaxID=326647 RepID=UPI0020C36EFD|nr:putative methyltransferase-domain-containing protein [Daldinia decipiens]KAI1659527.1 putative methyltransferase-domain-containing protein [Daldinia decipiens]